MFKSLIAGLGQGVQAWLGAPTAANLASVVTDKTGTGALVFATSPTLVTPALGAASATTINLTGGQIAFPAAQSASANANTLDDYEEGTWTPAITFDVPGDLSITYAAQVGTYTKIGRIVMLDFYVQSSAFTHATASGYCNITGLPFTSASGANVRGHGPLQWGGITAANYTDATSVILPNTAVILIGISGSGQGATAATAAEMPTGGTVVFSGGLQYAV